MIRYVFGLRLRSTQGFVSSLVKLMELRIDCPHYSRLSRRSKNLEVPLPRSKNIKDIVVDGSGLKVYGEGEWKVRQHGVSKRRTWRKMHLAVDPRTNEIVASVLTSNDVSDGEVLGDLLDQIPGDLETVIGDGSFDTGPCYREIHKREARPIIPPRRNAIRQAEDGEDALNERDKR